MKYTITIACALAACTASAQSYKLVDLGQLAGWTTPTGINAAGQISGWSMQSDSAFRAIKWDGSLTSLGAIAGDTQTVGTCIADDGRVFGIAYTLGDPDAKAVGSAPGGLSELGIFQPRGCNNAGDLVGTAAATANALSLRRACVYRNQTLTVLPTLGGLTSNAFDINTGGWVVGSSYLAGERVSRPALWIGTSATDLGTLAGNPTTSGQAKALNDTGAIVGASQTSTGPMHATLWRTDAAGVVTHRADLGTLPGAGSSFASAINAGETVVGTSGYHAFIWTGAQSMRDLNTLVRAPGWTLETASGINASGKVIGTGTFLGYPRGFMLVPMCTPADVAGLGGSPGPDNQLTADDLIFYLAAFFNGDIGTCDIATLGGAPAPDGQITVDDLIAYLAFFFAGCT